MSFEAPRLRRRKDEFADTEKARADLAELGLDDSGIFILLTDYGFTEHAEIFARRGGIRMFDATHFRRIAVFFRAYFASDKYPGINCDDPEKVDSRKWVLGLSLCAMIVNCVEEVELARECDLMRRIQKRMEGLRR